MFFEKNSNRFHVILLNGIMQFYFLLFVLPSFYAFHFVKKHPVPVQPLYMVKKDVDKIRGFQQLIRPPSILPTSLLCFSGGFMMNPSILGLLQTPSFIISTVNTILIMSSSMVINDIFDIENDRINSPHRPLVTGDISVKEAVWFLIGLLSLTEFLNVRFLSSHLQNIVHLSIINILLYTPIYKKIPFIKNVFCAGLISFSLFFSGLSATKGLIELNRGFNIFSVALSIIFFGSWYNEVLLDMGDIDGDRENRIYTIPVLYGIKNAWFFSGFLLFFNILSNTLSIYYLFGRNTALWLPCIFSPMIYHHWQMDRLKYTRSAMKNAVKNINKSLFALVLFLCGLTLMQTGYVLPTLNWDRDIHWLHIATTIFI